MTPPLASLSPYPLLTKAASADVFGRPLAQHEPTFSLEAGRRHRVTMACAYCRQRKIRCCGGSPCKNCQRNERSCEYTAVPEEVNKSTREKKLQSKATRDHHERWHASPSPIAPFGFEPPLSISSATMPQAATLSPPLPISSRRVRNHRRAASQPIHAIPSYGVPPPAPQLSSPAAFDSSPWIYPEWSTSPVPLASAPVTPQRSFPSVLTSTPLHTAYMADVERATFAPFPGSVAPNYLTYGATTLVTPPESAPGSQSSWAAQRGLVPATIVTSHPAGMLPSPLSTPVHEQQRFFSMPLSPPETPSHKSHYSPFPSPFPSPHYTRNQPFFYIPPSPEDTMDTSPTLASEPVMQKGLVGLGIGMPMLPEVEQPFSSYTPLEADYYPTLAPAFL